MQPPEVLHETGGARAGVSQPGTTVTVRCWGARGSIPSPGPDTAGYGGNTSCVEMRVAGKRLIFDAGTGIRLLGKELMKEARPVDTHIFLTHFHWDHIQGFPFFAPLFDPRTRLAIVGPEQQKIDVRTLFAGQMGPIYFPLPFEAVAADIRFVHTTGTEWEGNGLRVTSMRMRHPGFTVGYKVESAGGTVCYIPDNELVGGDYPLGSDWMEALTAFVAGSDLLVHDAMFTDAEYEERIGWGHSTYRQALELAERAGVRKLLFFHHEPERSDDQLRGLVEEARKELKERDVPLEVDAASEGIELVIEGYRK